MNQSIPGRRKLGLDIKARRKAYGMSQAELAARAGITQAVVSRLEQGAANPRLLTLEAIAMAFGLQASVEFHRKR